MPFLCEPRQPLPGLLKPKPECSAVQTTRAPRVAHLSRGATDLPALFHFSLIPLHTDTPSLRMPKPARPQERESRDLQGTWEAAAEVR